MLHLIHLLEKTCHRKLLYLTIPLRKSQQWGGKLSAWGTEVAESLIFLVYF